MNQTINALMLKNLQGELSPDEKEIFTKWVNESMDHQLIFEKAKQIWDTPLDSKPTSFWGKFTKQKIKKFIFNQAIGNFIGFFIGMSVTRFFSHYVTERRNIHNLFGLAKRKQVVVNDAPEWLQWLYSVIVGFIALEFVNHFIETKQHVTIWNYIKKITKK